jgi:2-amino-4-hydroxy-6-hydroxymethyldihydropteridine diphosphokinase
VPPIASGILRAFPALPAGRRFPTCRSGNAGKRAWPMAPKKLTCSIKSSIFLMLTFTLLLGSNQGNRAGQLQTAILKIEQSIGAIEKSSSLYETAAWGKTDQADFLNQAIVVISTLNPAQTLAAIHAIEIEMGRERIIKWGERIIDIDILYADDLVINLPHLRIPHPEIQNRKFAIAPLVEIMPNYVHPVLHKTNLELLQSCSDSLLVKLF